MRYKFRLISNEQEGFLRDYEILGSNSFYDLHLCIQNDLKFDKSQIASFFLCNDSWEKSQEITLFGLVDEDEEQKQQVLIMDKERIRDHVTKKKQKLLYVFDVFNERSFFIETAEISEVPEKGFEPCCSQARGCPPQQILMDQIFGEKFSLDSTFPDTEIDDDFLDSDSFRNFGYDPGDLDDSSLE